MCLTTVYATAVTQSLAQITYRSIIIIVISIIIIFIIITHCHVISKRYLWYFDGLIVLLRKLRDLYRNRYHSQFACTTVIYAAFVCVCGSHFRKNRTFVLTCVLDMYIVWLCAVRYFSLWKTYLSVHNSFSTSCAVVDVTWEDFDSFIGTRQPAVYMHVVAPLTQCYAIFTLLNWNSAADLMDSRRMV